jgi:uncharacterized coiled-coil DUF342 family protein
VSEAAASVRSKVREVVRDVKIAVDFGRYEEELWAEYQQEADRRFDVSPLAREIDQRMAGTLGELREKFDLPMSEIEAAISRSSFELVESERHRALLSEDHRARLRRAYERLNQIKPLLHEAYEDRSDGLKQRDEAQADIDWWYRKSKGGVFGSGGRQIPKYSIFGQSQNDLARYKCRRDEAYACIRDAEERIAEFKPEKQAVSKLIKELKGKRDAVHRLHQQGLTLERTIRTIQEERANLKAKKSELSALKAERASILTKRKLELGVDVLEAKILETQASKQVHLTEFSSEEARATRKLTHRAWWLVEHPAP